MVGLYTDIFELGVFYLLLHILAAGDFPFKSYVYIGGNYFGIFILSLAPFYYYGVY